MAPITSYHKLHCLKQQKFTLLQFGRPEIVSQGIERVDSFWSFWGKNFSCLPCSFRWLLASQEFVGSQLHHSSHCSWFHMAFAHVCLSVCWYCWKSLDLAHPPHWWRVWQPIPVFSPGESHGQRSLVARKESDMTEAT